MRILFYNPPGGASVFISQGQINALRDIGCVAERWDGKRSSWDSFRPDLYVGCSGHRQDIPADRKCQVALHVNPYGLTKIEPNINESQGAIDWVASMRPNVVFGYGHETDRHYWAFWDRMKIPWIPMATAGDATIFNRKHGTRNKYDVGYIGGRWAYKAKNLDPYLLPVLRDVTITHKVYGWGTWPSDLVVEPIDDHDVPVFLASCKIAPCISEPHTIATGIDLPERAFKAALSGAVVVHDPVPGLNRYIKNVITASNPVAFHATIKSLLQSADDLHTISHQQRCDVLEAHTYHHRMAALMTTLGFKDTSAALLSAISAKF